MKRNVWARMSRMCSFPWLYCWNILAFCKCFRDVVFEDLPPKVLSHCCLHMSPPLPGWFWTLLLAAASPLPRVSLTWLQPRGCGSDSSRLERLVAAREPGLSLDGHEEPWKAEDGQGWAQRELGRRSPGWLLRCGRVEEALEPKELTSELGLSSATVPDLCGATTGAPVRISRLRT